MSFNYSFQDLDSNNYEEQNPLCSQLRTVVDSGASFEMPQKIGQYSLTISKETDERKILFNNSKLTYLFLPPKDESIYFDLTDSYQLFNHIRWADAANVKLTELLQWILRNHSIFVHNELKPLDADFVTYRGVLTKLMVTPFANDNWLIGASKFKGTIYLCPYYDNDNSNVRNYEQNNLFSFGGHRFEHYLTRSEPNQPDCDPFTSEKGEFSVVMKSKLKSFSQKFVLMYAAEVDCLDIGKDDIDNMENFVEIKTTRKMVHENQHRNFLKFKLIKWWAQSYLIGVSKIICGYKDDNHIVDKIEPINVHNIPQQCSQFWSRRQCFNFLHQFLAYVKQIVVDDDPYKVYLFSHHQNNVINCRKLNDSGCFRILPDWYIKQFRGNQQ